MKFYPVMSLERMSEGPERTSGVDWPTGSGFVYFITTNIGMARLQAGADAYIKIGKAKNDHTLQRRMGDLQCDNTDRMVCVKLVPTEDSDVLEKIYHKHLETYRVCPNLWRHEWFALTWNQIEATIKLFEESDDRTRQA